MVISFLHPGVRPIVYLVLFSVTHDYDFAAEGFLAFLDETSKMIAYPIHLIFLGGFGLELDVVHVLVYMDIVELRRRRGICGRYAAGRSNSLWPRTRLAVVTPSGAPYRRWGRMRLPGLERRRVLDLFRLYNVR